MKKLILVALAVCAAPACALAQTTTSMTFSGGATVYDSAGACIHQGATGIQVSGSTITLQGVTGNSGCGIGPQPNPLAVSVTFPAATYTSGSPTVRWRRTPATTCTVTQTGPATLSQQTSGTTVTFAAPTVNGTYNFSISCALPATYTSITWSPGNSSSMQVGGTPQGPCDPTQKSDYLGSIQLSRQCTGQVQFHGPQSSYSPKADYTGNLWDLTNILSGGSSRNFMSLLSGAPMIMTVNSGSYVALAITPTQSGALNFAANPSYGDGGIISVSTRPGGLVLGQPGVICSQGAGGSNGIYISTDPGSQCQINVGTTYYINFADADYTGVQYCYNSTPGTCTTSKISYTEYVSRNP